MPPSPEDILAAITERNVEAKRARRRTLFLRATDLLRLAVIAAGIVYLARNVSIPVAVSAGVMLFALLAHDRQKRWTLEEELKKAKDDRVRTSAGSILQ